MIDTINNEAQKFVKIQQPMQHKSSNGKTPRRWQDGLHMSW